MEYYEDYPGSLVAFNGFVTRPRLVCGHCKQAESGRCMMAPRKKE